MEIDAKVKLAESKLQEAKDFQVTLTEKIKNTERTLYAAKSLVKEYDEGIAILEKELEHLKSTI